MKKNLDATQSKNWLKARNVSPELKAQILKMSPKELQKAFDGNQLTFGTAGVRGKMGPGTQYLNQFVYQQMAIGYCKYVLIASKKKKPTIMITHDNRLHSDEFALICAKTANAMGINVILPEKNKLLPTPILSFGIIDQKLDGGINITASHNPKEDNGFKVYNKLGAQLLPNETNIIIKHMPPSKDILNLKPYIKCNGKGETTFVKYDPLVFKFFDKIISKINIDKRFLLPSSPIKKVPIIFTGFHGTTTELLPRLLRYIGFKKIFVFPKHENISPAFENCPISNPEDPRAFNDVIKYATEKNATIIIGCDPDGDRMAIGFKKTNRWRFLNGNEMGMIFAHYILNRKQFKEKTPLIISTHVSASYVNRIAKKYKAEVMRTKTGFKWMGNMIDSLPKKYQFILGFEEAIGALVHDECRDKDAFGAVLLALEIYDQGNAYFPDLHDYLSDRLYDTYGPTFVATHSFTITSNNWKADAKKIMTRAKRYKERKIFDYRIKKIWYEDASDCVVWTLNKESWIKFRVSGTEPKVKVYFNFNNEMIGQLKAAAVVNIQKIEENLFKGISFKR